MDPENYNNEPEQYSALGGFHGDHDGFQDGQPQAAWAPNRGFPGANKGYPGFPGMGPNKGYPGFPGVRPGFPGVGPGYPGWRPNKGYPGWRPNKGYPGWRPNKWYPGCWYPNKWYPGGVYPGGVYPGGWTPFKGGAQASAYGASSEMGPDHNDANWENGQPFEGNPEWDQDHGDQGDFSGFPDAAMGNQMSRLDSNEFPHDNMLHPFQGASSDMMGHVEGFDAGFSAKTSDHPPAFNSNSSSQYF